MNKYVKLLESYELYEGEILPDIEDMTTPLRDDQSIRVFHGVDRPEEIYFILTKGLSGTQKANRNYSYEGNNNPYGLFVTPDFDTAKKFGAYIMELNVRIRDLEAPVWPNGSFVSQGQYAPTFKQGEREQALIKARNDAKNSNEIISQSDRPEVAATLLALGERQALFTGMLDPNSVKAVWMRDNPQSVSSPYTRMKRREFIKTYDSGKATNPFHGGKSSKDLVDKLSDGGKMGKLLRPRELGDIDTLIKRLQGKMKMITKERAIEVFKKNPDMIHDYVWNDSQYERIVDGLNKY